MIVGRQSEIIASLALLYCKPLNLPGLSLADVSRLNQMISNVAAQHVRSPLTVQTENVELEAG